MWIYACNPDSAAAAEIAEDLCAAGVEVGAWSDRAHDRSGVVILSEITAHVIERIGVVSNCGQLYVLAIAEQPFAGSYAVHHKLLAAGAADVLTWNRRDKSVLSGIVARLKREHEIERILGSPLVGSSFAGSSAVVRGVLRQMIEAAVFSQASILLTGESGTGKEVMARLIHELDPRPRKGRFVIVDCTTINPQLSGSELFGHVKGAFTSAHSDREGAFSLADSGTLFLDEVGELPAGLQAELLRVLQEKVYKPVGSNAWRETDFRLIAATNRDLAVDVRNGLFRHDLFFRVTSGDEIALPPLRCRREDIPQLSRHFLRQCRAGSEPPEFLPEVLELLIQRDYPGNVRQLRGMIERIATRYCGIGPVSLGCVPPSDRMAEDAGTGWDDEALSECVRGALSRGCNLKEIGKRAQDIAIQIAIALEDGNLRRAAERLDVSDRSLQLRLAAQRQDVQKMMTCGALAAE